MQSSKQSTEYIPIAFYFISFFDTPLSAYSYWVFLMCCPLNLLSCYGFKLQFSVIEKNQL